MAVFCVLLTRLKKSHCQYKQNMKRQEIGREAGLYLALHWGQICLFHLEEVCHLNKSVPTADWTPETGFLFVSFSFQLNFTFYSFHLTSRNEVLFVNFGFPLLTFYYFSHLSFDSTFSKFLVTKQSFNLVNLTSQYK